MCGLKLSPSLLIGETQHIEYSIEICGMNAHIDGIQKVFIYRLGQRPSIKIVAYLFPHRGIKPLSY